MTIFELQNAVEKDRNNHSINELAKLLLAAMNDWPTANQTSVEEFLIELKVFYGDPITLERLNNKNLDVTRSNDAWKHEAGASIAQIITKSNKLDEEKDFEKIIEKIFNYYKE